MFCVNCGSPLREGARFCTQCGTIIANRAVAESAAEKKEEFMEIEPIIEESVVEELIVEEPVVEETVVEEPVVEEPTVEEVEQTAEESVVEAAKATVYEYKVIVLGYDASVMEQTLNEYAQDGWKVNCCVPAGLDLRFVLEREV